MAVAGYFLGDANFIYKTKSGAKMSLFGYSLDILCMEHLRFWGAIGGGGGGINFSV